MSAPPELASRLHFAAIHLIRWLRREDGELGLSTAQLSVLSRLARLGRATVGELARAEQVRSPTMTKLVQQLERQRLVVRRRAPGDRRRSVVEATHRAWGLLESARRERAEALSRALRRLSARDRSTLRRAVAILEEIVAPPPDGASGARRT